MSQSPLSRVSPSVRRATGWRLFHSLSPPLRGWGGYPSPLQEHPGTMIHRFSRIIKWLAPARTPIAHINKIVLSPLTHPRVLDEPCPSLERPWSWSCSCPQEVPCS